MNTWICKTCKTRNPSYRVLCLQCNKDRYHPSEGDPCPMEGCIGHLQFSEVENCSCHINPPCQQCVARVLECPECGWDEEYGYVDE